jgi:outer membrane immunogenic protein
MKRILFAAVALAALVAAPAMGADLARPAPPAPYKAPPPVYFYSWTGCYIGGHAGGLWARKAWSDDDPRNLFGTFGLSEGGHNPSGFLGGLQGGCDYQFAGGFVVGIAGDYAWSNADATSSSLLFPGQIDHSRVRSLASVTGRVGYAWDRFLGYVKGGGAWERDNHDYTQGAIIGTASATRSGWTVGIGGEYAFTNFLTGFAEYDYYDFGRRDVLFVDNSVFGGYTFAIKETKSVFKVGLNLRWGAGPVVANY